MVKRFAAALLAAALGLGACGDSEEAAGAGAGAGVPGEGENVLVRAFPPGVSGGYATAAREVIRGAPQWAEAWKRANSHMAPVPRAPAVDFTKEMVALAALGEKPSGGHGIEIVAAWRTGGKLRILVATRAPAEGQASIAMMTRPWHAVVLPKSDEPVEWADHAPPAPPRK